MLFERYGEVMARLEELGARAGELNNRDRQVMQNLLEEQEWLSSTLIKRARYLLEEIDRNFEKLFDWMISFSDLIDRAAGEGGTPSDVMGMEKMMREASELREQLNRLIPGGEDRGGINTITPGIEVCNEEKLPEPGNNRKIKQKPVDIIMSRGELVEGALYEAAPAEDNVTCKSNVSITKIQSSPLSPVNKLVSNARKEKNKEERGKYEPPRELIKSLEQKMFAPFAPKTLKLENKCLD